MDTREAAQRWAETWQHGWRELDATQILPLYAANCRLFLSHPFRPHEPPRAYVERALAETGWADPWFGEPLVDRAAVEWWAIAQEGGADVALAEGRIERPD